MKNEKISKNVGLVENNKNHYKIERKTRIDIWTVDNNKEDFSRHCLKNNISCTSKEFSPTENRNDDDDVSIENEYDSRNNNVSRHTTTARYTAKGEIAVEKFVDTMMASEKYLKMIETVENKLSHLESVFLDRTNTILKYMTEVLRVIKTSPVDILENALQSLKTDLDKLKQLISQQMNDSPNLRGR